MRRLDSDATRLGRGDDDGTGLARAPWTSRERAIDRARGDDEEDSRNAIDRAIDRARGGDATARDGIDDCAIGNRGGSCGKGDSG